MSEIKLRTYTQHPTRPPAGTFRIYIFDSDRRMYLQSSTTEEAQDGVDFNGLLEKLTYERDDLLMVSDSEDSGALKKVEIGTLGGCGGTDLIKVYFMTGDWSPTVQELEDAGTFILMRTVLGDMTLTLPDPDDFTDDNTLRHFYVVNGGSGKGTVQIEGGGLFVDNLDKVVMNRVNDITEIGGYHQAGVFTFWGRITRIETNLQLRRGATWASTNFATPTAIPWDVLELEDNDSVIDWDNATPSRATIGLEGSYSTNYFICISSQVGTTWTVETWLRKNGSTEVPGTRLKTTMTGGQGMCQSLPQSSIEFLIGNYLELMVEHSNLNGDLESARMTLKKMV